MRPILALACSFIACSPAPRSVTNAPLPRAPADAAPPEDEVACANASTSIEEAERRFDPHPPQPIPRAKMVCARALLERAALSCPRLSARVAALEHDLDERARTTFTPTNSLSDDERWLLQ